MALLFVASAFLAFSFVRADVTPNTPAPGAIYNAGATCNIGWTPDQSGAWKTTNIELMTGNNLNMVHLTTVASVDGTTTSTFEYPCPAVTPNSAIYFYQFTSPNSPNKLWTGRFAIASANGSTVPPSQQTQPGGQPIPWGTGALVNPSQAVPAPPYLNGNMTSSSTVSTLPSVTVTPSVSSVSSEPAPAPPTTFSTVFVTPTTSSSAPASTDSPSSSGALGRLVVDSHVWHSAVALGTAAIVFTLLA